MPDIEGIHAKRAVFQEHLGKSAGGGANVQTYASPSAIAEMFQRCGKLYSAAGDIGVSAFVLYLYIGPQSLGRLTNPFAVGAHSAGVNCGLRLRTRLGKPLTNQE
jgi:hypothetical protein